MDMNSNPLEGDEQLLTMAEVASWLGTTQRFPRRLVAERRICFVKVGRHVRFPVYAVRKFIAEATVPEAG